MSHEKRKASAKDKRQVDEVEVPNEEVDALDTVSNNTSDYRFGRAVEDLAATRFGQILFEKADYFFQVIEQTAKWSLPQQQNDVPLERPLPWIFFLALIIFLRIFRVWLSLIGLVLGYRPLTAHTMVYVLQVERRNLRAIRFRGLKTIQSRETENSDSKNKNAPLMGKLLNVLSDALCRPVKQRVFNIDCGTDLDDSDNKNLTLSELLDKYANEDSSNDPDYLPKEDDIEDLDDSMNSYHSTSTTEETESENYEKSPESQKGTVKSKKDLNSVSVKENGGTGKKSRPEPLDESPNNVPIANDSDNEPMHTPKELIEEHDAAESKQSSEMPAATAEDAPPTSLNTPTTTVNYLAAPRVDESNEKSTPGHESAASLKPSHSSDVTGAGSLQDFHSIFHPAPIVKGSSDEVKTSTPTEAVYVQGARSMSSESLATTNHCKDTRSVSSDNLASTNQKKNSNHSTHNKKHHHYYNAKNRNKNRR